MILEIPCSPGGAGRWTQTTVLDGVTFQLTFDWLERLGRWCLHIADGEGAAIRTGAILNVNTLLLRGVVDTRRPAGELVVADRTDRGDADPGYADLGARFALLYFDAAELGR